MKKIYLFILLLITNISLLRAEPISKETAEQVAINFFQTRNISQSQNVNDTSAELVYQEDAVMMNNEVTDVPTTLYYIFDINNLGFVIVSGDDDLIPIIGYSTEGTFPKEQMPIHIRKWFQQYKNEIRYILENEIEATQDIKQKWSELSSANFGNTESLLLGVTPLLTTKWNQSPNYNAYCPGGSVTGCVATAMAQVMKYWNHPQQGTGYHTYVENDYGALSANFGGTTYNWGNMPDILNSNNDAVATLMVHCGISVNMDYSPQVSGAWVIEDSPTPQACSEYAFKNYFGYSSNLQGVKRENYTSSSWINIMKNELDAGRPILHAGFGSGGGHAFVCDGYDDNDYFHFNWGWGGNSDGYFLNDALNPGSLGTGGGSGGYNNGQQIIIGVQPSSSSGTQPTNIGLYSNITISPNPIQWGQGFTVNADIINNGTSTFYGDITAALFDDSGNFIDYIQTLTESSGLMPNFHYTGGLNFSTNGMNAIPGNYQVGIYVKPNNGNEWHAVGNGSYSNFIPVSIIHSSYIELYADIIPSSAPLIQNQAANFTLDLANYGFVDYSGDFSIDAYDLQGNWVATIDEMTGMSLCSNCHYTDGLTFSTSNLNLAPDTYLLAVWQKPLGGAWNLVGSTNFSNPIKIIVTTPQLPPDIYENNDSPNSAYNLSLSFSGNSAVLNTTGSNSHVGDDFDYYKVSLPSGYNYTITPRIHDSYNSGNGQTYTNDVLFSYKENGTWSDAYDDVINGSFTVSGNSTLYFHVAPYFQGQTGTYLLEIQLQRTLTTAIDDILENSDITVFPNPTSHSFNIKSKDLQIERLTIFDLSGRLMLEEMNSKNIDVSALTEGSYLLLVETDKGVVRKKFVKTNK